MSDLIVCLILKYVFKFVIKVNFSFGLYWDLDIFEYVFDIKEGKFVIIGIIGVVVVFGF